MGTVCSHSPKPEGTRKKNGREAKRRRGSRAPAGAPPLPGQVDAGNFATELLPDGGATGRRVRRSVSGPRGGAPRSRAAAKGKRGAAPAGVAGGSCTSAVLEQLRALEEGETAARRHVEAMAARALQMHRHDLDATAPSPPPPPQQRGGARQGYFDEDDDDDEGPRRCSMLTNERDAAAHVGRMHVAVRSSATAQAASKSSSPFSRASVRRHNSEDDLWVIVRGRIYDLTAFVDEHPGGAWMIVKNGGQDATSEFESAHDRSLWTRLDRFFVANVSD